MAKTFEIHPSIGIARVGNSEEFFIGPEPDGAAPAKYRDAGGKLKRQAARFRVFECERGHGGKLLSATEVVVNQTRVKWTVHLVNRKGAAPKFLGPNPPPLHRNGATGDDHNIIDKQLIIDPGEGSLSGANQGPLKFDTGKFRNVAVPLGDIRTDAQARLIVAGGFGTSASMVTPPAPLDSFADNDDWFDDVSDGPVKATVTITATGQTVEARPAWVIVGPPDFAPGIFNLVTLYDIAYEVAVEKSQLQIPVNPSFVRDIKPILDRAVGYHWVNKLSNQGHGGFTPGNFATMMSQLANPATSGPLATNILNRLRDPNLNPPVAATSSSMPRLHDETNSDQVLPLTKSQYAILNKWKAGQYVDDFNHPLPAPPELLPDALDRMALQSCSGGAFFPGIEAGQIMKDVNVYGELFHLKQTVLKPGQLTQGNALPWQADFHDCAFDASVRLGWWPAQRPDDVFPEALPTTQKPWMRGVTGAGSVGKVDLVKKWHRLGIVVNKGHQFLETERDPTLLPH